MISFGTLIVALLSFNKRK
ncbi:hypothetical protein M5X17_07790 [Paenibacillus alvei]|nr:hypothetical protein [Paenibacillus alvei]MCY9583095.1 hypothetical protein [Paenibacillus alvei]MCY9707223.1 hypothetical protein [Paenibacillus alvei]MCY9733648.1 hypothetical protein [Paenibacillus alvei]MCY9769338.1 hypothetical protein [Paenibacillus alvei]